MIVSTLMINFTYTIFLLVTTAAQNILRALLQLNIYHFMDNQKATNPSLASGPT